MKAKRSNKVTATVDSARSKAIKGPGLKTAGIIILQFVFIFFVESLEYEITKIGRITGIAIIIASLVGLYLGRTGTSLTNAVNPPIAFLFATLLIIALFGGAGLHLTRVGLNLVTSLADVAPYLITATLIGWGGHFIRNRSSAKSSRN